MSRLRNILQEHMPVAQASPTLNVVHALAVLNMHMVHTLLSMRARTECVQQMARLAATTGKGWPRLRGALGCAVI